MSSLSGVAREQLINTDVLFSAPVFDLRKKIFFDVLTFESKLKNPIKDGTKAVSRGMVSNCRNQGSFRASIKIKTLSVEGRLKKSAVVPARWLENKVNTLLKSWKKTSTS